VSHWEKNSAGEYRRPLGDHPAWNTSQYLRRDFDALHIRSRCWIDGFIGLFFSLLKRPEYEAFAYKYWGLVYYQIGVSLPSFPV
jgi:hypothetical protein